MRFFGKKNLQHFINTGFTVMSLFVLGGCVNLPTKSFTLPPDLPATAPQRPSTVPSVAKETITPLEESRTEAITPSSPPKIIEQQNIAEMIKEPVTVIEMTQPDFYESSASYYAKRFNGRRTFSGERYNHELMTAATQDFPLQSWIKVINPANGREITVRINDRTGNRKSPLIDLSRAAAKKLGFLGKGKIHVHVIPIIPVP